MRPEHDVVVVGSGLTGLHAATLLSQAGASVVVLEAGAEVGGRTRSCLLDGRMVDVGGELIGQHYVKMRHLSRDLGLHLESGSILPRVRLHRRVSGVLRPKALLDLSRVAAEVRALERDLDPEAPWTHPHAGTLDAWSLADWLNRRCTPAPTANLIESIARAFTTAPADQLSMLHFLTWLQPAGGLSAMLTETRWRIREGAQEVSRRLAARLPTPVELNTPVTRVVFDDHGVCAETASHRRSWRARHVLVCVPLVATADITFVPELPAAQQRLLADVTSPPVTKLVLTSADAPRRDVVSVGDPMLPLTSLSRHHGLGFVYGDDTEHPPDRLLSALRHTWGQPDSNDWHWLVQPWHDEPHIRGGYVVFTPGQILQHGPHLRASHHRIHLGGADRSTWPGTMEGALRDGERLASTVLVSEH